MFPTPYIAAATHDSGNAGGRSGGRPRECLKSQAISRRNAPPRRALSSAPNGLRSALAPGHEFRRFSRKSSADHPRRPRPGGSRKVGRGEKSGRTGSEAAGQPCRKAPGISGERGEWAPAQLRPVVWKQSPGCPRSLGRACRVAHVQLVAPGTSSWSRPRTGFRGVRRVQLVAQTYIITYIFLPVVDGHFSGDSGDNPPGLWITMPPIDSARGGLGTNGTQPPFPHSGSPPVRPETPLRSAKPTRRRVSHPSRPFSSGSAISGARTAGSFGPAWRHSSAR